MTLPVSGVAGVAAGPADVGPPGAMRSADVVEIRADLWSSIEAALAALRALDRPAIFTCRHAAEGGAWRGDEARRADLYREAHRAGAALLDVEARAPASRPLLAEGLPVLLSYHDFEGTPGDPAGRFREIEARGAAGGKVVPTARDLGDALRLLEAIEEAPRDRSRVGFAMGLKGVFTRILCLVFGSPLTYGSLGSPVAPGQLGVAALRALCPRDRSEPRIGVLAEGDAALGPLERARRAADAAGRPAAILPLPAASSAEFEAVRAALGLAGVLLEGAWRRRGLELARDVEDGDRAARVVTALRWDGEGWVGRKGELGTDVAWILGSGPPHRFR